MPKGHRAFSPHRNKLEKINLMEFLAAKGSKHNDLDSQAGRRQPRQTKLALAIDRLGGSIDKHRIDGVNLTNQRDVAGVLFKKKLSLVL
jgi:hypothetical protein